MTSLSTVVSPRNPTATQNSSESIRFGILSTYPDTPCGLATFSAALGDGLAANGADVAVVRVSDDAPSPDPRVIGQLVNGSPQSVTAATYALNGLDVAVIQHEYGIYGGTDGDEVLQILDGLHVPSIVVAHTVLKSPTRNQRRVLEAVVALSDRVVVMSESASRRLRRRYDVDPRKVVTIPHGASIALSPLGSTPARPTLLTWGLIGPGKGIGRVIDTMATLVDLPDSPRYLVAGRTHPKVLASDGEAYRNARIQQAQHRGVAGSVIFDDSYRDLASLSPLVQSASVVVLPYDSTDQVTSGVLVDSVASGRPVVSTAFPHAVELLGSGAGIVVDHDDAHGLATALRRVLTEPHLAESMAAEARRLSPTMAWPVVAEAYAGLAAHLLAERRARA